MSPNPKPVTSPHRWQNALPFAPAVTVASGSSLIFLSGQTGRDANGHFAPRTDIGDQARATFRTISGLLAESDSSLDRIVKLTYYVTDMTSWPVVAEIRTELFGDYKPPSTVMEVSRLFDPACLIEIDVIAVQA